MSTIGDVTTIPAGWYPDPENNARSRWWDGTAWTASVSEPQPPAPPLEPFVQASLPGPQTHFEQRPFEPVAEIPAAQPAFMPQQAELQQFVNPTGAHVALPTDGTLTRRQLRELTASGTAPTATPVAEPAAPAIAVPAPSAAPGTLYGDVAVMPSYGTPVTPAPAAQTPAAQTPAYVPAPVVAEPVAPTPEPAAALPLSAYPGPAVTATPVAAVARPVPAAIAAPVTSYEGLASPAMVSQSAEAPANPFASSTNPFSDPSIIVAPAAAAATAEAPSVAQVFAPTANPFSPSSFGTPDANPFSAPVTFDSAHDAGSPFNFDVVPAVPVEQSAAPSAQTGGIWFFALVPLIQAGLAYLIYVYLAMGITEPASLASLAAPFVLYLFAAEKDRKKLDALGHSRLPSVLLAILPLIYLIVRTARVGRGGAGALVVWLLTGVVSGAAMSLFVLPAILPSLLALI